MNFSSAYHKSLESVAVPQSLVERVLTPECKLRAIQIIYRRRTVRIFATASVVFIFFFGVLILDTLQPHNEAIFDFFQSIQDQDGAVLQMISFNSETGETVEAVFCTICADDIGNYSPEEWDDFTIAERNVIGITKLVKTKNVKLISNYLCIAFYEPKVRLLQKEELAEMFGKAKTYNIDGFTVAVLRITF